MLLTWQPRGAGVAATLCSRCNLVALMWLPRGGQMTSSYAIFSQTEFQPISPHTFLTQSIYISAQQMPNRFKTDIPRNQIWPKKDIHHLVETTKYHHITIYITRNNRSPYITRN
jgi:hypothetical protein